MTRILLSPPHLDGDEQRLVAEAIRGNQLTQGGPQVEAFEREMAAYTGAAHGLALSSGTAALHLALRLLGVGPDGDVWLPSFVCATSADPFRYEHATPVFIDSDQASWGVDPALLAQALDDAARQGRLPKAVVVAHLYGQCADLDPILAACGRHGVPLIEDASQAVGALYKGRHAGTLGRLGVQAFDDDKIISAGGGAMLLSSDAELIGRARRLATPGNDVGEQERQRELGINCQLSSVLAAIGRGQLARVEAKVAARRRIAALYRQALSDLPGLTLMSESDYGDPRSRATRWLTCVLIDPKAAGTNRDAVRTALEAADIEACPLWKPLHLQPVFAGCRVLGGSVCAGLFERGLCLPSGSAMTDGDVQRVVGVVRGCWG